MKYVYFILSTILLTTCTSNSNDLDVKQKDQNWKLVKMTGSVVGSETTGSSMDFQEEIILKSNGEFSKVRTKNNKTQTVSGTYSFLELDDGTYLELSYPTRHELIGNCTGNLIETYWMKTSTRLQGTWLACDGPGLEYEISN